MTAAADDVCALPAAVLFLPAANASAPLTRCWSENAGVTVSAPCAAACACRRLEVSAGQQRGTCLNTTAGFRCTNSGGTDCSAYVLNADGSSTLRNRARAETPRPSTSSALGSAGSGAAMITPTIAPPSPLPPPPSVGATTKRESDSEGFATWVYALIVLALVLGVALVVLSFLWCRRRRGDEKHAASTPERTEAVGAWKDMAVLEAEAYAPVMPAPPPPPVVRMATASTATTAFTPEPALNLAAVAGVSSVDYHTYRVGSTLDDNALSSVTLDLLAYPPPRDSYSSRRSSLGGGERLTGGSRLSSTSAISYGSEMDSFSSHLTFNDSEPRDTELASDAHYHAQLEPPALQQRFFGADTPPFRRKQSTEF